LTARLSLQPQAASACVPDEASKCVVGIGDQVRTAYERAIRRMFRPLAEGATPDVEIEVTSVRAETGPTIGGRSVTVNARARITAPASGEIGEVSTWGEALVLGPDDDSIGGAGLRAMDDAVAGFPAAFAGSERIEQWLLGRGVSPLEPVGSPARAAWVGFGEIGLGTVGSTGDTSLGIAAHFGFEGKWFALQGVAGRWQATLNSQDEMTVWDLGVEAGPVVRLGAAVELRGGVGIHALLGSVTAPRQLGGDVTFDEASPSLFLAAQFSIFPGESGARLRGGMELRQFLAGDTTLQTSTRDTVTLASTYLGVYLGFEIPWHARATARAP
jgi:hypothetical protein